MEFHPGKCQLLKICRKKNKIYYDYKIHNQSLKESNYAKYLGITIDNELRWREQNKSVCQKANNTLAFLRRNIPTNCSKQIKEQCFKTLVKPILEYGCCVWDPHLKNQINNLEKVHKNAARFVTNNYQYEHGSTLQNMKQLGWTPLEEQRARNKMVIFFKATNDLIDIPINDLIKSNRRTRNSDSQTFNLPASSNDCHMHSFFPSSIRLWNKLESGLKTSEKVDNFKHRLQYVTLRSSYN